MLDIDAATPDKVEKKSGYHHGNLKNAIVDAVAKLIRERQSLDFRLKDVARLVGTTQPAIYRHFENKQALLVETAVIGYGLQRQFRDHALEVCDAAPLTRLLAVGSAYIHFSRQYPGYFLLMKVLETQEILSSRRYQKQRDVTLDLVRGLINECISEGYFVKTDPEIAMTTLQSTALGFAQITLTDQLPFFAPKKHKNKELVSDVFSLAVSGLLTAKGKRHLARVSIDPFNAHD
ncbi:MAG: TetR/AcrR family transcriptional regulator [Parvularculaceae bacterium]